MVGVVSPMSTVRRVATWAVLTAVGTSAIVLGGMSLADHYVAAPRSERIERAVNQSEANGRALTAQAERSCEFFIATADALATLADSPDLSAAQRGAIARMQTVARTCQDVP